MSYTSTSKVLSTVKLSRLREIVELLGYIKTRNELNVSNMVGNYFWYEENEYRSWSGVELQIYSQNGEITVETRSTISRSYWDLKHQNKTLKIIRDLFGGNFTTDAGRNRYWHFDEPPPSPVSSGCYMARWAFHNAVGKVHIYLMTRKLEGAIAREKSSGLPVLDQLNPRLLSNNLLVPYVIAAWEEYFRATFIAALRYSTHREGVLKRTRLKYSQLELIINKEQRVERAIADSFSFQRPSSIAENFRLLDPSLDIGGAMRKPYKGRRVSLYDSIEALVERRNKLVHSGRMNIELYDNKFKILLNDIEEAVNRAYEIIGKHYRFSPISAS